MAKRSRKPAKKSQHAVRSAAVAKPRPVWLHPFLLGALLVLAVFVVYQPAWHGAFLWEDELYAGTNPLLSAADGFRRIWFSFDSPAQYFPLTHSVFRIEKNWLGGEPTTQHVVNLLCHAGAALILWRLLQRLRVPGAWFGAALFALHPVQVESVAQISELKNVLMGLCFIASLYFWVVYLENRRASSWFASFVCYVLALAAKTTACVMPAALLLILWLRKERFTRKTLLELAPFVFISVAAAVTAFSWEKIHNTASWIIVSAGSVEKFLIASRAVFFYLGKLVWPANLAFNYPGRDISRFHFADYLWVVAVVGLAIAVYLGRRRVGRGPEVAFLYFISSLSPLLGFVGVYTFRYTYVADHYQYLACIGPLALFAAGCVWVSKDRRYLSSVILACVLAVLSWLTWNQAHIYQSADALWLDTLQKNPKSWMAENNYGTILGARHEPQAALTHFLRSYELAPNNREAARNVGVTYLDLHQPILGLPYLQEAERINPRDPQVARELARGYLQTGRVAEGVENLKDVLALDPNDGKAHTVMASALLSEGRNDEAKTHLREALTLQPDDVETLTQLANLSLQMQQYDEAAELLHRIVTHRPDGPDALKNYAWLLATCPEAKLRDGARAVDLAERARARAPQSPFIQATLAASYAEAGRFDEARQTAGKALQVAEQNNLTALAMFLRQELALFENSQPYRDVR